MSICSKKQAKNFQRGQAMENNELDEADSEHDLWSVSFTANGSSCGQYSKYFLSASARPHDEHFKKVIICMSLIWNNILTWQVSFLTPQ